MTEEMELTPSAPTIWPHSPANEEAFLGAALIDPEALREINLLPEDFYIRRNQWVYEAILDLMRSGQDVDFITVSTALDKAGHLREIGGQARVMELINAAASSLHIESYAEVIAEKARRRRVLQITRKLTGAAFAETGSLESAISEALEGLSRAVVKDKGAVHISHFISLIYDEVNEAINNPKELFGITTGFSDWDAITGGLQRGEVVKISGEPGLGKSLLAMQVLTEAAKAGYPGALYELEMSGRQVVRRGLSRESQITTAAMRSGKIAEVDIPIFTHAIEAMGDLPIYISDSSVMTTMDIRADLQRLKDNHGVAVAVIDYEGLLDDDPDKDDNARSKLISKRVHDIFKDLDLAGISIMDMTKDGIRGSAKGQSAVAGTARSLHDADQIIVMRKGESENVVRLTWEKMREGGADRFMDLVKLPGLPAFGPVTTRQNAPAPAQVPAKSYSKKKSTIPEDPPDWGNEDLEL
jgi:replicative DNA helicase